MSFNLNDALKNRTVIILAALSAVFFLSTVSSCSSAIHQKARGNKELAARLALEEKISKFSFERSALEEKAKAKEKEAQELKASLENANKSLAQEQLISQSLREESKR